MFDALLTLKSSDWAVVFATLVGPVLAVQAQKWVESLRGYRETKQTVFKRLMATRGSRLAPAHVEALNMIDVAFYGRVAVWRRWQTTTERAVVERWHEYLDSLAPRYSEEVGISARRDGCFIELLSAMCADLGYAFDRVTLRNNSYSPQAHNDIEGQTATFRAAALDVVTGVRPLRMEITNIPQPPRSAEAQ